MFYTKLQCLVRHAIDVQQFLVFRIYIIIDIIIILLLDEKPFKCTWEDCDRSFKRRESLTDHIKRHKNLPIKVQDDVLHYLDHHSNWTCHV